ncbi:hypothetical protein S83_047336, partial [Arachis hypogaea]
ERMTLLKLLAEKKNSKIIEWTKAEMQMLRGNVKKLQLQNWNLAQSNTHMLAAEASGKSQMAIEKMVEGRLRKYFEEVVLMEQKFIVNDTMNAKEWRRIHLWSVCLFDHSIANNFCTLQTMLDNLFKEVGSPVRVVSAVNILHDWDDEECLKILKNCWKAIHRMME